MHRQILQGDSIKVLKKYADESIDIIITSPPYWALRDYGTGSWTGGNDPNCTHKSIRRKTREERGGLSELQQGSNGSFGDEKKFKSKICPDCNATYEDNQIGLEEDFKDFLKIMKKFMDECRRVLKPTGTVWINLGDTYSNSGKGAGGDPENCKESFTFNKKPKEKTNIQPKSLVGIPQRFFIQCIDDGWIARNDIPWIKNNTMPSSKTDGFTNKHEYIYFFSKTSKTNFYYHEVTGEATDNLPKNPKLDVDYVMVTCYNGSSKKREPCAKKTCNLCRGTGKKKKSFWHGVNYFFNLDPVREKTLTSGYKSFNVRVRDSKKGYEQAKLTGGTSEAEDEKYNSRGEIKEKYKEQENSNVLRLHRSRKGNPYQQHVDRRREARKNGTWDEAKGSLKQDRTLAADGKPKKTYKGFNERYRQAQQRKHAKSALPNKNPQSIATNNSGNFDIETGKCLNHENGKNPGDIFETPEEKFENGKWRKHYDDNGNCLGCGKSWRKHTVSERAKGSIHEASKRTEDIVWCNPLGKNPGDIFHINTAPYKAAHFATFPPALPLKILKCACPPQVCTACGKPRIPLRDEDRKVIGHSKCNCNARFKPGIVLDPFFGAGTTGLAAEKLGLEWTGIELSEEYIETATKRLEKYKNHHITGMSHE